MKIVLADSNELVRLGIRSALKNDLKVELVGEATSSESLLDLVKSFETDVVVVDYTSKGFSIDVIVKLRSLRKHIHILAITPEQSAQTVVDALRSGVMSYVKKDCSITEIVDAVRETGKGNKFFCGQILETIQVANLDVDDIDLDAFSCEPVVLSERESEIIVLIAEGNTNAQIADMLFLSNHTVGTHRKNIMSKLGVRNTAGIVMYAVKTNLISPNKFLFAGETSVS
ncbi:MAG: response regulator transcription factor [Crocinitomicaceae bacterium]|nr:response regulator transcription factor [Crocinitomicaceae bacterium]